MGYLMMVNEIDLYEAAKNKTLQVVKIPDIGLMESLGLRPGTLLTIKNKYGFGGPVLLRIGETFTVAVGKDIAKQVVVKEV